MKKFFLFASIVACLASCGHKSADKEGQESADSTAVSSVTNAKVYSLDSLLAVADQLVNQTVTVKGSVTHTCKHSGKRCFLVGENENVTMRVEAKGNIGGFNRELVGSELTITGILKERRMTKAEIDEYEKQVNAQQVKEDGSAESCEAELSNITEMRNWMKEHNKDYYSIYYMDGEEYNVVNQ